MDLNDGLYDRLKAHLDGGKPRLECFVGMLLGLLQLKQVNLTQLAVGFASDTDITSRYHRLQRFFVGVYFDYDAIAGLQMQLFDFPRQQYYLTLVGWYSTSTAFLCSGRKPSFVEAVFMASTLNRERQWQCHLTAEIR